jgi:uncharacterized protein YkwD
MVLALAACGGGAGGTTGAGGTNAIGVPGASPTAPPGVLVAGSVVELPADAYGPAAIAGVTYASADATQTAPLANATVIVGPVPITGATPPAQLPAGDVATVTGPAGTFAASVAVAPAAPALAEPFVIPQNNVLGFIPPANGYYVEVFGSGTDGKSAGVPLPLHRFLNVSGPLVLRVSKASAAEAAALAAVNGDRAANAAGPLIFDESAEDVARLHAADATARGTYICHYDASNVGPSSRYLAAGGIGLGGEGVGIATAADATAAFGSVENAFLSEKTASPPGAHFTNLVDPSHLWAGLAATGPSTLPFDFNVDYELITPSAEGSTGGASGYASAGCPPGIVDNNS